MHRTTGRRARRDSYLAFIHSPTPLDPSAIFCPRHSLVCEDANDLSTAWSAPCSSSSSSSSTAPTRPPAPTPAKDPAEPDADADTVLIGIPGLWTARKRIEPKARVPIPLEDCTVAPIAAVVKALAARVRREEATSAEVIIGRPMPNQREGVSRTRGRLWPRDLSPKRSGPTAQKMRRMQTLPEPQSRSLVKQEPASPLSQTGPGRHMRPILEHEAKDESVREVRWDTSVEDSQHRDSPSAYGIAPDAHLTESRSSVTKALRRSETEPFNPSFPRHRPWIELPLPPRTQPSAAMTMIKHRDLQRQFLQRFAQDGARRRGWMSAARMTESRIEALPPESPAVPRYAPKHHAQDSSLLGQKIKRERGPPQQVELRPQRPLLQRTTNQQLHHAPQLPGSRWRAPPADPPRGTSYPGAENHSRLKTSAAEAHTKLPQATKQDHFSHAPDACLDPTEIPTNENRHTVPATTTDLKPDSEAPHHGLTHEPDSLDPSNSLDDPECQNISRTSTATTTTSTTASMTRASTLDTPALLSSPPSPSTAPTSLGPSRLGSLDGLFLVGGKLGGELVVGEEKVSLLRSRSGDAGVGEEEWWDAVGGEGL